MAYNAVIPFLASLHAQIRVVAMSRHSSLRPTLAEKTSDQIEGLPSMREGGRRKSFGGGAHKQCSRCGELALASEMTRSVRCPACKNKKARIEPAVTVRYL